MHIASKNPERDDIMNEVWGMWCEVLESERTKEKILVERQKAVRFKGAMVFYSIGVLSL